MSFLARYRPLLLRFCRRRVICEADADEVVQDTLMRALQAKSLLAHAGERTRRAWLIKVARRRCVDLIRSQVASRRLRDAAADAADMSPLSNPRLPMPEYLTMSSQVREALSGLDPTTSACLLARLLTGRNYAELSQEFGVSEAALQMRVSRAVRKLRSDLEDYTESKSNASP